MRVQEKETFLVLYCIEESDMWHTVAAWVGYASDAVLLVVLALVVRAALRGQPRFKEKPRQ